MRNFANFCRTNIAGLFVVLLLVGCKGESKSGEETKSSKADVEVTAGKIDPLELPQDTRIVPQIQPRKGEIKGTGESAVETAEVLTSNQSQTTSSVKPQIDTLASQALRIQLHSTELFGEAKRERLIAEEVFDQPVYLDYEVPYYKVRVGSFASRKDAEFYLQKAKSAGYQNAWIVAVKVNVKEAQPLYENLTLPKAESGQGN